MEPERIDEQFTIGVSHLTASNDSTVKMTG